MRITLKVREINYQAEDSFVPVWLVPPKGPGSAVLFWSLLNDPFIDNKLRASPCCSIRVDASKLPCEITVCQGESAETSC